MDVDPPVEIQGTAPEVAPPKPIVKLDNDVINKIAAAEIIHRPANAIKELLENSLDAGSSSIKLSIKEGGLKLIQITDNGHGINRADLPLLCTRYATSKLREFRDLESIATYGFRGEALASISYCSHVEVVTKTKADGCGWKAHYSDGELVPAKPGATADPKPAAANDGTIISAEDLFFNMPLRKRAFKSVSDEYNRILDVVTKYAVHNPHCAWVCKKAGSNLPDITTPAASTAKANISLLYTPSLANELLEVLPTTLKPEMLGAKCRGWVSNANSSWARKGGWLLFINNRLVESSKIRKAIESMYTAYLPKGASPWVYLSLEIDPAKVDVNVHPTKSEVHFLNEDEMIAAVVSAVHEALKGANSSRSFTVQTLLPGAGAPMRPPSSASAGRSRSHAEAELDDGHGPAAEGGVTASARHAGNGEKKKAPAPNYKVRTDLSARTLDAMLAPSHPSQMGEWTQVGAAAFEGEGEGSRGKRRALGERADDALELEATDDEVEEVVQEGSAWSVGVVNVGKGKGRASEVPESMCEFTSIHDLRRAAIKRGNAELYEILAKHAFVGVVDRHLCLSMIQHSTKLYLVNHASLADEHFYQLALRQFGTMDRLRLDPPPDLRELLRLAAEDEPLAESGLSVEEVVDTIYGLLMDKREMIDEYFSLAISPQGNVTSLPMIMKGYTPNLDRLPHFLLCLGTQVDWEDEKECFSTILRELAFFYSPRPFGAATSSSALQAETARRRDQKKVDPSISETVLDDTAIDRDGDGGVRPDVGEDEEDDDEMEQTKQEADHALWQIQHVLFPSFRRYTSWPAMGKEVVQVANLPDLFRIFERC